jgi:hypothetical protein
VIECGVLVLAADPGRMSTHLGVDSVPLVGPPVIANVNSQVSSS